MTPSEVIAASNGTVRMTTGAAGDSVKGLRLGATGNYTAGPVQFLSQFYFSPLSNGLGLVKLTPKDPGHCGAILGELQGVYGTPVENSNNFGIGRMVWVNDVSNIRVQYDDLRGMSGSGCIVGYEPVTRGVGGGL